MTSQKQYILGRASTHVLLLVLLAAMTAPQPASGKPLKHSSPSTIRRSTRRRRPREALRAHAAVIGGSPASAGTFPALAYITGIRSEAEGFACTGTVVASNLILTAAHCAENLETGVIDEPAGYTVVTNNVDRDAAARQVSTVSKVIVYPGFLPSFLYRDAALLVLTVPTTAPPIPLWTSANAGTLQAGRAGEIVGWGSEYYEQESLPSTLKWANTAIQSPEWCAQNAPGFFEQQGELCTINPPSYSTGACHGDSGGPLLVSSAEGPVEIGITSHGDEECSTLTPTVFTRTDVLVSWVHEWAEAEKPPSPVTPPAAPPPSAPVLKATPASPATAPTPKIASSASSMEGVYRGSTSQSAPINVVVGAGGHRITAIATRITYRCRAGHSIAEPMDGLSNRESEPISASHTFTVAFSGEESETVTGAIEATSGEMSGTISARWLTHHYGLCSTGRISWAAQRAPTPLPAAALAGTGNYHGWTNQGGHVFISVAPEGKQLIDVQFSARYQCAGDRSLHLTESFLSPTEPLPLESLGTFTLSLGGLNYTGRVDGALGLNAPGAAFGTLEASTVTHHGRCRTGVVPWET